MSTPDHARANFQTLLRAAADGNLALMGCRDAATGEIRYVICAVGRVSVKSVFTPFDVRSDRIVVRREADVGAATKRAGGEVTNYPIECIGMDA
jgi:hypothetical protein